MQGVHGEERLLNASLPCLPSEERDMTSQDSLPELATVVNSRLFAFCSEGGQQKTTCVRSMVDAQSLGQRPDIGSLCSNTFIAKVSLRLALFCKHVAPTGSIAAATCRGAEALNQFYDEAKLVIDRGDKVDLATLRNTGRFHWMLTEEQRTNLKRWTSEPLGGLCVVTGDGDDDKRKEQFKAKGGEALKNVMSLLTCALCGKGYSLGSQAATPFPIE